ncbi:MAG: hypothetical protein ABI743_14085 [bacterium]
MGVAGCYPRCLTTLVSAGGLSSVIYRLLWTLNVLAIAASVALPFHTR